jgi:curved DNA-binding protein
VNYYEILGVEKNATTEQIKVAYKELAKKYHPDNKETGDNNRMQEINSAYDTLKDPSKKLEYDAQLSGNNYQAHHSSFYQKRYSNIPDDVLKDLFPEEIFENIFGGFRQPRQQQSPRNKDMLLSISISIKDAYFGCDKIAQIREGNQVKTLSITIPKGVRNGTKLKIAAQAPRQNLNLPAGDVIVHINVQQQNDLAIVENNLVGIVEVSQIDALIGTETVYKHINGEDITVEVPPGTRHAEYVKVFGKGMSILNSDERGDLLLQVQTKKLENLPKNIKNRLKKISEDMKKSSK